MTKKLNKGNPEKEVLKVGDYIIKVFFERRFRTDENEKEIL
jgi:hypothetical protein